MNTPAGSNADNPHTLNTHTLPASFYLRNALEVARELLGKVLVRETSDGVVVARIVEVEAYRGPEDRAAHTYGGRRTRRNASMWMPGGRLYVYFCYGMHWCMNAVVGEAEQPEAVLLRAAEILSGDALVHARRKGRGAPHRMLRGPACLCQGLAVTGDDDGRSLLEGPLRLLDAPRIPDDEVGTSPRIGVDYAGEHAKRPWRFFVRNSRALSGPARFNRTV